MHAWHRACGILTSHGEPLRWLEDTMATMRRWLGRAAQGRPVVPQRPERRG